MHAQVHVCAHTIAAPTRKCCALPFCPWRCHVFKINRFPPKKRTHVLAGGAQARHMPMPTPSLRGYLGAPPPLPPSPPLLLPLPARCLPKSAAMFLWRAWRPTVLAAPAPAPPASVLSVAAVNPAALNFCCGCPLCVASGVVASCVASIMLKVQVSSGYERTFSAVPVQYHTRAVQFSVSSILRPLCSS
jgi:hypothetical protein